MIFYEPHNRDKAVLPHNPFTALVAPRPVGWISTISATGAVNVAPYSYFNAVAGMTPVVMFSSDGPKDTLTFVRETGEFVWNMATFALREAMNLTSADLPRGESEFDHAGLATAPSRLVRPPRVAASPVAFECRTTQIIDVLGLDGKPTGNTVVMGQVVGVHLDEAFIRNGRVDTAALKPLGRCGYHDYAVVDKLFEMKRPT